MEGGGWIYPFHLQPIQAQVGAFLPQGCPYLVSGLQSSSHSPHLTPTTSFPTRPPSHHNPPASLWLRPKLGPLIQALWLGWGRGEGGRQQEGRRACLTWTGCPGRSQPQGWAPDLSPWQPVGGGALLPHLLMRHSQWQAATLDSPLRWRQPPGYFQSHLVSQRRRQEGALVL